MLSRLRRLRAIRSLVRRIGVHRVVTLAAILQWPVHLASRRLLATVPRDPRLVVMGSPLDRFADNAAYLFLHMSEHADGLETVWISGSSDVVGRLRSQGYRAERRWSRRGVLATVRAGTFVYAGYRSDINAWLSHGARTVSLWHGLPIKRVESSIGSPGESQSRLAARVARIGREAPPDFLLSSSDFVTECFSDWFNVPADHCWELGYPRSDHLVAAPDRPPAALVWHDEVWERLTAGTRVVGLFLTWRDDLVDDVVDEALVRRLVDTCEREGAVLVYKAHYNVAPTAVPQKCVLIPGDADLHAYLGLCDVLITDYSSIALDFLLMRRPVVYYMPDLEHYAKHRGLAIDPETLPGILTRDQSSLLKAVESVVRNPDSVPWTAADEGLLTKMWGAYDGHGSVAIVEQLEQTIAPGSANTSSAMGGWPTR